MPEGSKLVQASEGCSRGRRGELRKQLEAGDVLRSDDAETASVKGSDAGCAGSLSDGDEAAVDAAEVLIGVLNGERGDRVQSAGESGSTRISLAAADS